MCDISLSEVLCHLQGMRESAENIRNTITTLRVAGVEDGIEDIDSIVERLTKGVDMIEEMMMELGSGSSNLVVDVVVEGTPELACSSDEIK